jgi:hypothetical protein
MKKMKAYGMLLKKLWIPCLVSKAAKKISDMTSMGLGGA